MNHIPSPDNSDSGIERLIQEKGLVAPRITPIDIDNSIQSEYYFTAANGVDGSMMNEESVSYSYECTLELLTFCILVLKNGFTVTGESACASPENFDAEVGRKIAKANAVNKIWPLLGYELKTKLQEMNILKEYD